MDSDQYLRFLIPCPSFLGIDRVSYGPFVSGDLAYVPGLNARALLKRKVAVPHNSEFLTDKGFAKRSHEVGLSSHDINFAKHFSNDEQSNSDFVSNLQLPLDKKLVLDCATMPHKIWTLPGQSTAYESCNSVVYGLKCGSCGGKKVVYKHCDRPECPLCRNTYAYEHARDMTDRLIGCNNAYLDNGVKLGWFKHFMVSPPQEDAIKLCSTHDGFKKLRASVNKLLLASNVKGGAIVFHYYRIIPEMKERLRYVGYGTGKDSNGSLWEGILLNVLSLGSSFDYVYAAPHFHILGVGTSIPTKQFKKLYPGWILHNISTISHRLFVQRERHMLNIAKYQLHHASRFKISPDARYGTLAVTYFGLFGNSKVKVDEVYTVVDSVPCESCTGVMHLCGYSHDAYLHGDSIEIIDWDNDLGEFLQKRRIKKYVLK